ncbi:MAG: hypothetical protein SCARUB_04242 [Candidatus Scalindua rubra]|uniref:Uncharacterized protein n=1 Tax=Candidatus Scalindua rubra TaxID=1872076 RepID=A0A1E3X4V1_9BACT|nr:MAG: hypothetical protein SCARUB_04242 [Candidatus Scalindua rubra]
MIYSIQYFSDSQIEELKQCPGLKIDINNRVAEVPFIAEGLFSTIANNKEAIKELKQTRKTYKIYSKILDDFLWIAATDKELQELVNEGIKEAVYTQDEVSKMIDEGISKEVLKKIHKVKKAFPGSQVENIENG